MDHDHIGQLIFCGDGQEAFKKKKARPYEGCGLNIPLKNYTEKVDLAPGGLQLCNTCARLTKSKQYCGICNKIWNHSDKGSWVRCDGCKVWVHAECDKIPTSRLKVYPACSINKE